MFRKPWVQWLTAWLVGILVGVGIYLLLLGQKMPAVASVIAWIFGLASVAWLYYGLWCWRKKLWVKWAFVYVTTGLIICWSTVALYSTGYRGTAIAFVGVWTMAIAFVVGLIFIRFILTPGLPIFGVARTLVDEAIRMKVALVFIVAMMLIVPIIPVSFNPRELLAYRMESFLSWSLSCVSILLGMLTIFLSCMSICTEISTKQIFMTMSKPIGRFEYLVGKWLGIVLINVVLLVVAGAGIYVFARILQVQPAPEDDHLTVDNQVLIARQSSQAQFPAGADVDKLIDQQITQLKLAEPDRYKDGVTPLDRAEARKNLWANWLTIGPHYRRDYLFTGLGDVKNRPGFIQLHFKVRSTRQPPDGKDHLAMWINGRPFPLTLDGRQVPVVVTDGLFQVQDIPTRAIADDGTLTLAIGNINLENHDATYPSSIAFSPGDGLEILYRVGSFEGNLARGMVLLGAKLAFLAMLGLAAGTFLGFPTACLLSFMVYFAAGANDFLKEAIESYSGTTQTAPNFFSIVGGLLIDLGNDIVKAEFMDGFKVVIRLIGEVFIFLTPSFSHYDPVEFLADGRVISGRLVFESLLRIALVSTAVCALAGWIIFRRRELAKVIV